jgi:Pvc16 N-terminal domain
MAGASVIHDLLDGLAEHLTLAWQQRPLAGVPSCAFNAWGVADLKQADGTGAEVAIQLVRVAHNEHLRNRPPALLPTGRPLPLTVNVHLLISIWADSALKEQGLVAWTMRELHQRPFLDPVALVPEDLSLDELSKLWQVLVPPMRPSIGYLARNVQIDLEPEPDQAPVIASRIVLSDELEATP